MPRLTRDERREQLMTVATRLFAEYGFDATTTAHIARAAGITEPILYRYFSSKPDLYLAIVRAVSQRTIDQWQQLLSTERDPLPRLRLLGRRIPAQIKRLVDAQHVLHGAMAVSRDRRVLAAVRDHYRSLERILARLIVQGQQSRVLRRDRNATHAAWQLLFLAVGYALVSLNIGPVDDQPAHDLAHNIIANLEAPRDARPAHKIHRRS